LENKGKKVVTISLAQLMWEGIEKTRGISYVVQTERRFGFKMAQTTVNNLVSKLSPLPDMLEHKIEGLDPNKHIVFLTCINAKRLQRKSRFFLIQKIYRLMSFPDRER